METSLFIAKLLGLCYLIIGIGVICNRKFYQQVMVEFSDKTMLSYYGGVLALVVGITFILTHNIWRADWAVIITIIGWIALVKGIWLIVFPKTVSRFLQAYRDNPNLLMVNASFALGLGALLTYFGFFAG